MNLLQDIVRGLEGRGMSLWAEDGQIRFRGPRHVDNAADLKILSEHKEETLAFLSSRMDRAPVTVTQRLWLRPDRERVPVEYLRTPATFDLEGPLDVDLFERAIQLTRERQDILRTRYGQDEDGALFQTTQGVAPAEPMRLIDLGDEDDAEQRKAIWLIMREAYAKPPRYEDGQPMASWMFRLGEDRHVFSVIIDHIALDNRSMEIIITTIFAFYDGLVAGVAPSLPPIVHRYSDYARSNQARQDLAALGENLAWWQDKIGGLQSVDLRDPLRRTETRAPRGTLPFRFTPQIQARAAAFAKTEGLTMSVLMTAVFGALMARWSHADRVMVGYLVDDRPHRMAATAGAFIRTSPVIVDLTGDPTARELFTRTRAALLDTINPDRAIWSKDVPRLAKVLINLQTPTPRDRNAKPGGLTVKVRRFRQPLMNHMTSDLQIFLKHRGRFLFGHIMFAADRVNPNGVKWLRTGTAALLERMTTYPDERMSLLAPPRLPAPAEAGAAL